MTTEIQTEQKDQTPNHSDKTAQFAHAQSQTAPATDNVKSDNPTSDTTSNDSSKPESDDLGFPDGFHHGTALSDDEKRKEAAKIKKAAKELGESLENTERAENGNRFNAKLENAKIIGAKYRDTLHDSVAAIYDPAYMYNSGDHKQRNVYREHLQNLCGGAEVTVTEGKTSPYHMIAKLVFGDERRYASYIVHVIRAALGQSVKPEDFRAWLTKEGGLKAITVKYDRNGKVKPPKIQPAKTEDSATTSKDTSNAHARLAREHLKSSSLVTLDQGSIGSALDDLKTDTELSAIVVRQADGTFVVKAVIEDEDALDAVYAGYYKTNAEQLEMTATTQKIAEVLTQSGAVSVGEIRKQLGDEIANKAANAAKQVEQYREHIKAIPPEFDSYLDLLKRADFAAGARSTEGYDSGYEKALEELAQRLEENPSLQAHLDRPFSTDISPDPESVPRPKGSKSMHAKGGFATYGKQDAIREVLEQAIEDLRVVGHRHTEGAAEQRMKSMQPLLDKARHI